MTVPGHADRSVFQRYTVRRDDVQANALERQEQTSRRSGARHISWPQGLSTEQP